MQNQAIASSTVNTLSLASQLLIKGAGISMAFMIFNMQKISYLKYYGLNPVASLGHFIDQMFIVFEFEFLEFKTVT